MLGSDVLTKLLRIKNLEISYGPKNPKQPREELSNVLVELVKRNPFLREDAFYIEFLEIAGGLCVDMELSLDDPEYYFASVYELDGVLSDDSMAEITDGFFVISEVCYKSVVDDELSDVTCAYALDATGNQKQGVYKAIYIGEDKVKDFELEYEGFEAFLKDFISRNGMLRV